MTTTKKPSARKPRRTAPPEDEAALRAAAEGRIRDPIELDAAPQSGLEPGLVSSRPEYYGFDIVPPPDRPPQTEREREVYTLGDGEMLVNMGPQHPSTHGVLRVVLKLDGERVVDIDPVLGYLHRGVEKLVENADYHQTISQVDPLEYISSLFCEWAPVCAYEQLLDVEIFDQPQGDILERAQILVLLLELDRAVPDRLLKALCEVAEIRLAFFDGAGHFIEGAPKSSMKKPFAIYLPDFSGSQLIWNE